MTSPARLQVGESRAHWMRNQGRELYEAWTADTLDYLQGPVDGLLAGVGEWADPIGARDFCRSLHYRIGQAYGDLTIPTPDSPPPAAAILLEHQASILDNTAASSFGSDRRGVLSHAADSLMFGVGLPIVLAADTLGPDCHLALHDPARLGEIAGILDDPSFLTCLNELGEAGFAVYRSSFASLEPDGLQKRMERVGCLKEFLSGDIPAVIYRHPGTGDYTVHPKVLRFLAATMKRQNTEGLVHVNANAAAALYGKRPPVTAGCPLREPALSRLEINHGQSGIAQTSQWLAKVMRQLEAVQARQFAQNVGAVACSCDVLTF